MKIQYSIWKIYIIILPFVINVLMLLESVFLAFLLVFNSVFMVWVFAESISFELRDEGIHKNWSAPGKVIDWSEFKSIIPIPFLNDDYFIFMKSNFIKNLFFGFQLLPTFFMKNKKDLIDFIKEKQPALLKI